MVIGIIAMLAAIALPVVNHFKPNYAASLTRRLLDELARARQLAVSQRSTVCMVFVPTNFWNDSATRVWRPQDWAAATNLLDKQLVGYAFVCLRTPGDQPGQHTVRYFSKWRTLPEGGFINPLKFVLPSAPPGLPLLIYTNDASMNQVLGYTVYGFDTTPKVPFPLEDTPRYLPTNNYVSLPYIAFDYMGRRVNVQSNDVPITTDALLPLAKGSIIFSRDPVTKKPLPLPANPSELPPGNSTNSISYNVIRVDWLTGRARVEHQEIR